MFLKSGNTLEVEIIEIRSKDIKYKNIDSRTDTFYYIPKKKINSITLKSGYTEKYTGKLNQNDYIALCERKIKKFTKQKNRGLIIFGVGMIGISSIGAYHYRHDAELIDEDYIYLFGSYYISSAVTGLGAFLFVNGSCKVQKYKEKIESVKELKIENNL
jgi:hypothetical protein